MDSTKTSKVKRRVTHYCETPKFRSVLRNQIAFSYGLLYLPMKEFKMEGRRPIITQRFFKTVPKSYGIVTPTTEEEEEQQVKKFEEIISERTCAPFSQSLHSEIQEQ